MCSAVIKNIHINIQNKYIKLRLVVTNQCLQNRAYKIGYLFVDYFPGDIKEKKYVIPTKISIYSQVVFEGVTKTDNTKKFPF